MQIERKMIYKKIEQLDRQRDKQRERERRNKIYTQEGL